jgi:hypothetical protein
LNNLGHGKITLRYVLWKVRLGGWGVAVSDGIQISGFGTLTSPARISVLTDTIVVGVVRLEGTA